MWGRGFIILPPQEALSEAERVGRNDNTGRQKLTKRGM